MVSSAERSHSSIQSYNSWQHGQKTFFFVLSNSTGAGTDGSSWGWVCPRGIPTACWQGLCPRLLLIAQQLRLKCRILCLLVMERCRQQKNNLTFVASMKFNVYNAVLGGLFTATTNCWLNEVYQALAHEKFDELLSPFRK